MANNLCYPVACEFIPIAEKVFNARSGIEIDTADFRCFDLTGIPTTLQRAVADF